VQAGVERAGQVFESGPSTPGKADCTVRRGDSCRQHDPDPFALEQAGGGGEPAAELAERGVDQNERRRGRIVAETDSGRGQRFRGSFGGIAAWFVLHNRAGYGPDLVCGDCARTVDHHGRLGGVEDSGFEAVVGGAGIEDGVDAAVEIAENVFGCGWTGVAEEVGAGRGDR